MHFFKKVFFKYDFYSVLQTVNLQHCFFHSVLTIILRLHDLRAAFLPVTLCFPLPGLDTVLLHGQGTRYLKGQIKVISDILEVFMNGNRIKLGREYWKFHKIKS